MRLERKHGKCLTTHIFAGYGREYGSSPRNTRTQTMCLCARFAERAQSACWYIERADHVQCVFIVWTSCVCSEADDLDANG